MKRISLSGLISLIFGRNKDRNQNKSEMIVSGNQSVCIGVKHTAEGVIPCPPCSKLKDTSR